MPKKSFTLLEIIVVLIAIGVFVTLGIPAYKNAIEDSKAKVCRANLDALGRALDIYAMENDSLPGTISQLPWEYIQRGYAEALERKDGWKIQLAYFLINLDKRRFVYADTSLSLKRDLAKGNINLITCPADETKPVDGYISYGINSYILGRKYRELVPETPLIGDCDNAEFDASSYESLLSSLALRHKHNTDYALVVLKNREVKSVPIEDYSPPVQEETPPPPEGPPPPPEGPPPPPEGPPPPPEGPPPPPEGPPPPPPGEPPAPPEPEPTPTPSCYDNCMSPDGLWLCYHFRCPNDPFNICRRFGCRLNLGNVRGSFCQDYCAGKYN